MHHTLPFYGRHQARFLKAYMALGWLAGVPLLGRWIKSAANRYAQVTHGAVALTADEAEEIVRLSDWVAVGRCTCRETFHNCDAEVEAEIVVGFGAEVYSGVPEQYREVSLTEAVEILKQCRERRLIPMMMQCYGHYYAICNCCTCCCVPLRLKNRHGIEYAVIRRSGVVSDFVNQLRNHGD
jgi:hypothetical protein